MRASDDAYGVAVLGPDDGATGAAIGIAQPATRKATTDAAKELVTRIHVISPCQSDRSSASRIRRGSTRARWAVKTRSQRALLYSSSDSVGRLMVPIQPSPVSLSTFPLRRSTGMSSPSISVFTG